MVVVEADKSNVEAYIHICRNMAVGIASMSARVGGIIAPYIVLLVRRELGIVFKRVTS